MSTYPPFLQQTYRLTPKFWKGSHSAVYHIAPGYVAKAPKMRDLADPGTTAMALYGLQQECDLMAYAFGGGMSVPQPQGMFTVRMSNIRSLRSLLFPMRIPSFVMEYIPGVNMRHVPREDRKLWERQYDEQYQLANRLRIHLQDSRSPANLLWNLQTRKLTFIDAEQWSFYGNQDVRRVTEGGLLSQELSGKRDLVCISARNL